LTNEKGHLWQLKMLAKSFDNMDSFSYGEKLAKFGICGKVFNKVCTLWRQNPPVFTPVSAELTAIA